MFEPRNRRELSHFAQSRSRSRREDFSSVRDPACSLSRPIHTPPNCPPPKNPYLVCFHALLGAHVVCILDIFPTFSEWRRVPFFRVLYFRESLFLMHECLNRDHHSCDKPLKAKVFFILYPSRSVYLKFNNAPVLWIAKISGPEVMFAETHTSVQPLVTRVSRWP
jgi:hypothetical protein